LKSRTLMFLTASERPCFATITRFATGSTLAEISAPRPEAATPAQHAAAILA